MAATLSLSSVLTPSPLLLLRPPRLPRPPRLQFPRPLLRPSAVLPFCPLPGPPPNLGGVVEVGDFGMIIFSIEVGRASSVVLDSASVISPH